MLAAVLVGATLLAGSPAFSQVGTTFEERRVEQVTVEVTNPTPDEALNRRIADRVRKTLGLYPNQRLEQEWFDFALSRARRDPELANIEYVAEEGASGGVILNVSVTLREPQTGAQTGQQPAAATWPAARFPEFIDANGVYLRAKLEGTLLHYGNANAWYGRPDLMLAGNPLVVGTPSGRGYHHWGEAFVHAGLYGMVPISDSASVYGGVSAIASGSLGQELFTDQTRGFVGIEDAYAGLVAGTTTEAGNRVVFNALAGRKRFMLGDGFLIASTSANGHDRAALQANPRWAADLLALAQFSYNDFRIEAFHLDPDELPIVDSGTVIQGVNAEAAIGASTNVGVSFLRVPRSTFGYFTPTQTFTRAGLQVYDLRFRWQPHPAGRPGPFLAGEFAVQRNDNFDMLATGYYAEAGYSFADLPWSPTLSYRFAHFSGDDPSTARFERWDPLLSGGNGEQWVQGINHFKIYQNSNLIAHRVQLRLRPLPKVELVPQFWIFRADSKTNLGGNPALSFLSSRDLGWELNLTAKYFASSQIYVQGHVAATFPGAAVKTALGGNLDPWWSTMLFVRAAF